MSEPIFQSLSEFDGGLLELADAYCNGSISQEDLNRLNARLESDQAAMEAFVVYLDSHSRLQRWAGRACRVGSPILTFGETAPPSPFAPQADSGFLGGGKGTISAIVIASLTFLGLALWLFTAGGPDNLADNGEVDAGESLAGSTSSGSSSAQANSLSSVRSIQFEFGTATLGLDKIGTVVIEGPADFQMLSPMRARLSKGKIKVRVSENTGRGFQVETPNGLVTDLGTEFLLNVSETGKTDLAVLEGKVDFQASLSALQNQVAIGSSPERLIEGDGIRIDENGNIDRIVSIIRANAATFHSGEDMASVLSQAVIVEVSDNLQKSDTKKFYEIVPSGLREDAKAYADAIHEWNGVTAEGIPSYLIGADYVKTFNQHSIQQTFGMCVTLARPAKLYIFFDSRSTPPEWLVKDFRNTGDRIGLDATRSRRFRHRTIEVGPGNAIDDQFTIWEREVREPCKLRLGTNLGTTKIDPGPAMYGVAAVPLEIPDQVPASEAVVGDK